MKELLDFLLLESAKFFYTIASPLALAYILVDIIFGRQHGKQIKNFLQKRERWQPVGAAILGVVPGCGGDTALIKMYGEGRIRFFVLVALSLTTLGDTIFFLLTQVPKFTFYLQAFLFGLGMFVSYNIMFIENRLPKRLTPKNNFRTPPQTSADSPETECSLLKIVLIYIFWLYALSGTLIMFAWRANLIKEESLFKPPIMIFPLVGLAIFILFSHPKMRCQITTRTLKNIMCNSTFQAGSLVFTIFWVVTTIEIVIKILGFEVGPVTNHVVIASLVGLIPNCGVQIAMATLFIEGKLGLAAFVANMTVQDGDGLIQLVKVAGWKPALALKAIRFGMGLIVGYVIALFI